MKVIAATELDLLAFFEVPPAAADADVPWSYNTLLYSVTIGGAEVSFRLVPSYRDVHLVISFGGRISYELKATQVSDVMVHSTEQVEALEIRLTDESRLWLALRPRVSIWHEFQSSQ